MTKYDFFMLNENELLQLCKDVMIMRKFISREMNLYPKFVLKESIDRVKILFVLNIIPRSLMSVLSRDVLLYKIVKYLLLITCCHNNVHLMFTKMIK
jgi:hypothetical protein